MLLSGTSGQHAGCHTIQALTTQRCSMEEFGAWNLAYVPPTCREFAERHHRPRLLILPNSHSKHSSCSPGKGCKCGCAACVVLLGASALSACHCQALSLPSRYSCRPAPAKKRPGRVDRTSRTDHPMWGRRRQQQRAGPAVGVFLLPGCWRQGPPPGAHPACRRHPARDRPAGKSPSLKNCRCACHPIAAATSPSLCAACDGHHGCR